MWSASVASNATSGRPQAETASGSFPGGGWAVRWAAVADRGVLLHLTGMDAQLANPERPLPADVPALQELVRQLLDEVGRLRRDNEHLRQDNERLQHRLDQALRQQFGRRSERARPRRGRLRPQPEGVAQPAERPGHGRQSLPEHLPRERVEHDLPEAEKPCPCCGRPRACIGEQVSEQLDYRPASYFVVQHVKKTYACRHCDGPAERRFTTAGPATAGPIAKGLAGPGLLAHLVTCKYADHLPLHRLEGIVARSGVTLARSTLCDWMAQVARLLAPLVALMQSRLLQSRVIHSDDTPVPFREAGKDKTSTGHLWVYIGDRDHPYVRFDFTTHYRRDGPEAILQGYAGYLQADALAQYEGLFATGSVLHVACNAHARRRFVDAQASAPEEAAEALAYFRKLYQVERELAGRFATDDDAGRQRYRSARTAAVRDEFHSWLLRKREQVLPKSPLGDAIGYALSNWAALMRYTEQGYLAIDNNLAERTLRQVALGRNNWQFCGSPEGGRTAAALYSVVGTCKHLGVDPFVYLREALPGLSALGEKPSEEALTCWLPDVWKKLRSGDTAAGTPATPVRLQEATTAQR
jgi:transposase